jgi:hypothetical protein
MLLVKVATKTEKIKKILRLLFFVLILKLTVCRFIYSIRPRIRLHIAPINPIVACCKVKWFMGAIQRFYMYLMAIYQFIKFIPVL